VTGQRPEVAVGGVVVRDGRLLLVRRGRGAGIGLWSVPGGRVEFGETMEDAVRREVWEEVSLRATTVRYLGHVERIGGGWHYVIHDYLVHVGPGEPTAGDDADAVRWVRLTDLAAEPGVVPGLVDFLVQSGVLPA